VTVEVLLGALLVLVAGFLAFSLRRRWLVHDGGAVEMSLRLKTRSQGRGWVLGMGRFDGDELQWFRVFSLSPRPRRTLDRRQLLVTSRRAPKGPESLSLMKGMDVVVLQAGGHEVEIALDRSALTGFLAWLEARPPGATLPD
jgi:hypothetical protein